MATQKKVRGDERLTSCADKGKNLDEQLEKHTAVLDEIIYVVGMVEDNRCSTLLIEYCVNDRGWHEVAEVMNLSTDYVKGALYRRAIESALPIITLNNTKKH
jgi:hypothetical protein